MPIPTTFAIGANKAGLAVLMAMTPEVVDPASSFTPWAVTFRKADGVLIGQGYPQATWHWDIIPAAARALLRAYWGTSLSVVLCIRMINNEGAWHQYDCVGDWPPGEEDQYATRTRDLLLTFTRMVVNDS